METLLFSNLILEYKKGIESPLLELIYNRFNYMYHIANKNIPREKWIDNRIIDKFIENEFNIKRGIRL